jgi:AAA family ATP:ADP antiporter
MRAAVKGLIDLLVDRAGRAAGGLLLLILTAVLSLSVPALSIVAVMALVAWIAIAFSIRHEYVQAFRIALEKKVIEPESFDAGALDSSATASLLQALASDDERQVLYALDMLGNGPPARWSRHLPLLLEHSSPAVRSRCLALLTDANVLSPKSAEPRLLDPELNVRIEAVRHLSVLTRGGNRLTEFLGHSDYRIVLAAIHCIAKYRPGDGNLIDEELIERALATTGEHALNARTAAARALAIGHLPRTNEFLDQLLRDSNNEVIQQAIRTSGEISYEDAIPLLVPMLARAPLRRDAREALLKMGEPALRELMSRLRDPEVPLEVRKRIPRVLSFSERREIAEFLLDEFEQANSQLAMPLLRALNRMRAQFSEFEFDVDRISGLIRDERAKYQHLEEVRQGIRGEPEATDAGSVEILELLDTAIGERLEENIERVFRLLQLIYPPADIHSAYFSFSSRPTMRASAVEFLDNLLDPSLRPVVVPLVEQPEEEVKEGAMTQSEALQTLLREGDALLQSIAAELVSRRRAGNVPSNVRIA